MIVRRGIYAQYQEQVKDALSFDRTYQDGVIVGTNFVTGARTVAFWVKPVYTTYNGMPRETLSAQYGSSGQRTFYVEFRDTGVLRAYISTSTTGNNYALIESNAGQYFNVGQWYYVAVTIDSLDNKAKIYVDGVLQTNTANSSVPLSRSGAVFNWGKFGSYSPTSLGTSVQKGLNVWTISRSASQISSDMTRTWTGAEIGLKAYFPTNEGSGNTIQDINSVYTGTITTTNTTPNYIDDVMWVNS